MVETIFDPLLVFQEQFVGIVGENVWNLILYTIGIAIYAIFVWHFYKFVGRRDVFGWDTEKYERSGAAGRFVAGFFYIIKYLVAFPVLVFIWFGVFATFMFVLGQGIQTEQILLTSFALVTAIRIMAYYHEEIANDVAKMVPLGLLAVYIVQPAFLDIAASERIFDLATFITDILKFTAFSIAVEWFLRIVWSIKQKIAPHTHVRGHVVERFGR